MALTGCLLHAALRLGHADQKLSETQLEDEIQQQMPQLGAAARSRILEAGAIAAYHAEMGHGTYVPHPASQLNVPRRMQFTLRLQF